MPWNLLTATIRTTNTVRLAFDLSMEQTNETDIGDALNPENYVLTLDAGAGDGYTRRVAQVDQLDPVDLTKVDVRFWPSLTESASTWKIETGAAIFGDSGEVRGTTFSKTFSGLALLKTVQTPEEKALRQDYKNDAFTGKFSLTDEGVYETHRTIDYLKKRTFRRLVTIAGGFSHLPVFGEGLLFEVKRIVTPSEMRSFKNNLRQGLLKDADVVGAEVSIEQLDTGIMKIYLKIKTSFGLAFEQVESFSLEG